MKKSLTNLKGILILLILFVAVGQIRANNDEYYYNVSANVSPVGAGKVYVSATNSAPAEAAYKESFSLMGQKSSNASNTVYLYAQPAEGFALGSWTGADGKVIKGNPGVATFTVESKEQGNPDNFNFTANFVKEGLITVNSDNEALGTATLDNVSNEAGDNVQLSATCQPLKAVFAGWSKEGSDEIISKENPYTVVADAKCKYIAHFRNIRESGGAYYRVYSLTSNKYLWMEGTEYVEAIKSQDGFAGAIFLNSIVLYPESKKDIQNAGSIIYLSGTDVENGGLSNVNIKAQGVDAMDIVKKAGRSLTIDAVYSADQNAYKFFAYLAFSNRYLKDGVAYGGRVGNSAILCGGDDNNLIELQPLTEETMDKYYFGAVPAAKMLQDGKYYTSMYTAFPYKCMDGVKAYYVSALNSDGTAHMTEIASGKVPANTGVVLECNGATAKENRLIPLTEDVPALTGKNYLKGYIKLNGEAVVNNSQATMRVFNVGGKGVGFYKYTEGKELTSNKAYLDVSELQGAGAKAAILMSFGETTGIDEIENDVVRKPAENVYYDLQGRRVKNPSRGIYILNGKKIFVK